MLMGAENNLPEMTLFLVIPIVLTTLICLLVKKLKKKKQSFQANGMPNVFSREMANLFLIMTIFDLSFFIRLAADIAEVILAVMMQREGDR